MSVKESILFEQCLRCGGPLPCIECAKQLQKERGFKPEPEEEPSLAPEIAEAARKIREEGFLARCHTSKRNYYQEPWTEEEYRRRAGVSVEPLNFSRSTIEPLDHLRRRGSLE